LAGADDHPLEQRFLASGIDTCHPGQKATVLTPQFRARILTATRKMPNDGSYALELPQSGSGSAR